MIMEYNYTIKIHPWGASPELGEVGIDPVAGYGYWERKDGSEGGGLWFEGKELIDYDGHYCLPAKVEQALRVAGYNLD